MDNRDDKAPQSSFFAICEFIPLIWSAMRQSNVSFSELSRQTGITKSKLSRSLSGKSQIEPATVHRIFLCLNIDIQRALFAIGYLRDWNRYYDPDIVFVSDLIRKLPDTLAAARDGCERVAINDGGIDIIAGHIGAMIADNDRKVAERRNAFSFDRDSRRSG